MEQNNNTAPDGGVVPPEYQNHEMQQPAQSPITPVPPRKNIRWPLFVAGGILIAAAAAAGTYVIMKQTGTTQPVAQTTAAAPQPVKSQAQQVADVISYAGQQLSAIGTVDGGSLTSTFAPHRLMSDPYNFYAAGTDNANWKTGSKTTGDFAQATTVTKAIYDHLVNDLKAKADTIDGDPTVTTLGTKITDSTRNYYRLSTDAFTCGLVEQVTDRIQAQPYTATSAQVTLACSTADEYTKNAELQKPIYAAYGASKDYSKDIMLGLPTIKASATSGYQTAQAQLGNDGQLVGGSVGLFYQTPDKAWHFFTGVQNMVPCSQYNTADLKAAYAGEQCGAADGSVATVKS